MTATRVVCAMFAVAALCVPANSAEIYGGLVYKSGMPAWNAMKLKDRARVLSNDGITVGIVGELSKGDYDKVLHINNLVPIVRLHLSSGGGLVSEALLIAEFTSRHHIQVQTDISCDDQSSPRPCGCASACALIWLAAPVRAPGVVKVHRPYFRQAEWHGLPDSVAMQRYNEATIGVRTTLSKRGYSSDFIEAMFRVPREKARLLPFEEMLTYPKDVALDELISAKCYGSKEKALVEASSVAEEIRSLNRQIDEKIKSLPDIAIAELRASSRYSGDLVQLERLQSRVDGLRKILNKYEAITNEFLHCKNKERIAASIRTNSTILTSANKLALRTLANELSSIEASGDSLEIIARLLSDLDVGRNAKVEMDGRHEKVKMLWDTIKKEVPAPHLSFLMEAL